ncbi:hypothetical protein Ahy_B08g093428 [Arachis hypogaea]|uniref:Endonuclease/exonuclease/phosphatase domain-containing protein n=1 Tax=Arachis hypogaea TaxID=3818 RepID=A0A444Y602_ARAHY|nr:hypothetical protein Ahy_B08g093428 [Arachis hypogaea]
MGMRREQWKEITATNYNKVEPQLFIGDFNDVLTQEEKMSLHPKPHSQVREFRSFVDSNFLMDLDLKGGRFTWFSNPRNRFVTRERIDRTLVNWEWRLLFENASLTTMPAISSDHSSLILDLKLVYKIRKSFKFEAFWADNEECEKIVKKGWEKEVSQSYEWTRITRRMNNCKEELKKWRMFPHEISTAILKTPISVVNKIDWLYWPWREDVSYTVRTGYHVAKTASQELNQENSSTSEDKRDLWREI